MPEYWIPLPKKEVSDIERGVIHERLLSFGIPYSFTTEDGTLKVSFPRPLPPEQVERLPELLDIWLKPTTELNFDLDMDGHVLAGLVNRLADEYGAENVKVRRSAHGRYHVRVDKELPPEQALELRRRLGDDPRRVRFDEFKLRHGLQPGFLYDQKYGKKAGKWQPVEVVR